MLSFIFYAAVATQKKTDAMYLNVLLNQYGSKINLQSN